MHRTTMSLVTSVIARWFSKSISNILFCWIMLKYLVIRIQMHPHTFVAYSYLFIYIGCNNNALGPRCINIAVGYVFRQIASPLISTNQLNLQIYNLISILVILKLFYSLQYTRFSLYRLEYIKQKYLEMFYSEYISK